MGSLLSKPSPIFLIYLADIVSSIYNMWIVSSSSPVCVCYSLSILAWLNAFYSIKKKRKKKKKNCDHISHPTAACNCQIIILELSHQPKIGLMHSTHDKGWPYRVSLQDGKLYLYVIFLERTLSIITQFLWQAHCDSLGILWQ